MPCYFYFMEECHFQEAVEFVLSHEGIYSDHQYDPGGPTKFGISLRYLKKLGVDLDHDGDIDLNDVKLMTKKEAIEIYKTHFWDKYGLDRFKSFKISKKIFDLFVNMGSKPATIILQKSINNLGFAHVEVDGILGAKTIAAANLCPEQYLLEAIRDYSIEYYKSLVNKNPLLGIFLKGWINRANDL